MKATAAPGDTGYDIAVLGRLTSENSEATLQRNTEIIDALPDSVGKVEIWAHFYSDGSDPDPTLPGYAWADECVSLFLLQRAHNLGRKADFYINPGKLITALGDPENMKDWILNFAELRPDAIFDGVYFDGLAPYGYATETTENESFDWLVDFKGKWLARYGVEPIITQHSSGRWTPSKSEYEADYAYFGEHGGPMPPWATATFPAWSVGEWTQMDRIDHPQQLSYRAQLLKAGVWPIYKMASIHKGGNASHPDTGDSYPVDWPTYDQWMALNAVTGAARVWAWTTGNISWLTQYDGLRMPYRDIGTVMEPVP